MVDPCEGNPHIAISTYNSPDGKHAKIYKNTQFDHLKLLNFLSAAWNWNCWIFVQGTGVAFLIWLWLPNWITLPFIAIYLLYMAIDKSPETGGRWWALCRLNSNIQVTSGYFSMRTLIEEGTEFDETRQYIFGFHPHGAHMLGTQAFHLSPNNPLFVLFPRVLEKTFHTCASIMFMFPILREVLLWYGWIVVSRKNLERHLKKGNNLGVIVGGEIESIQSENLKDKVVLEGRKGFVRLAVRFGVDLVPTYTFHLNETFTFNLSLFAGPRRWIQRTFKICLPVLWGRWGTPIPHPAPLLVAVGKPIQVPKNDNPDTPPDEDLVDRIHAEYTAALCQLFESYKGAAGYAKDRKLEVLRAPEADRDASRKKKAA